MRVEDRRWSEECREIARRSPAIGRSSSARIVNWWFREKLAIIKCLIFVWLCVHQNQGSSLRFKCLLRRPFFPSTFLMFTFLVLAFLMPKVLDVSPHVCRTSLVTGMLICTLHIEECTIYTLHCTRQSQFFANGLSVVVLQLWWQLMRFPTTRILN